MIEVAPPTWTLFAIPTPPATIKAPVVLEDDSVVSCVVTAPVKVGPAVQLNTPDPLFCNIAELAPCALGNVTL